ncbi:MAG: response regulator transcription factor [Pseudomonadota bacterium]
MSETIVAQTITIMIVDDHPLFREGVVNTLMDTGLFEVVAQSDSQEDAVSKAERYEPNLVLLDVNLPGGGIETAEQMAERAPASKVIMLTVSEDADDVQAALSAHAKGYVLKGVASQELIEILSKIHLGESYIPPNLAATLLMKSAETPSEDKSVDDFNLNQREKQILERLAEGLSNREIAEEIHLSEKTVKHYMTQIMNKLHVSNRVQAAIKAHEMNKRETTE